MNPPAVQFDKKQAERKEIKRKRKRKFKKKKERKGGQQDLVCGITLSFHVS